MIMINSILRKMVALSLAAAFIIPVLALEVRSESKHESVLSESKYDRVLNDQLGLIKMTSLAAMEYAGYLGQGMRGLITDPDPSIRLRCAEILGQVDDPLGTIYYLSRLCMDEDPEVQKAAIFSLGLAGHRKSTEQMTLESINGVLKSAPSDIKAIALQALGLTRLQSASKLIIPYLTNFNSSLRVEAVMALSALGDSSAAGSCMLSIHDPAPRVVAATAYAMGRLGYCKANAEIIALLTSEEEAIRMAAAEALGRLKEEKAVGFLFQMIMNDKRMGSIKAAEALSRIGGKKAAEKLEKILQPDNPHFNDPYLKTIALRGIASSGDKKFFDKVVPFLDDESIMVRTAAIPAVASTGREKARKHLRRMFSEGNHYDRMVAAEYLGASGDPQDLSLLVETLDSKTDHFSREGAASGLGKWPEPEQLLVETKGGRIPADALIDAAVGDDWVVASLAVEALGKTIPSKVIDDLVRIFNESSGRLSSDIKLSVINALSHLSECDDVNMKDRGTIIHLLKTALTETDPRIPKAAVKAAAGFGLKFTADPLLAKNWDRGTPRSAGPVLPFGNVSVELVTSRGVIGIVLFGDDAPCIVRSFLDLVEEGFYRGLNFHRVVPGFVVQGGCPRGDGWGDAGYFLRSQFNTHRYERGTLGVAHAGRDTPGSQFFITHLAQPHLNGRYTVIGKVVSGMETVDLIEIGDAINIRILE